MSRKSSHPVYQQVIAIGSQSLPFLLKELDRNPSHYFAALQAITGKTPTKTEHRGRIRFMAKDWLGWGRDRGYHKLSVVTCLIT
ncbi:MAG: hypothetical protein AAFR58_07405 [Cyanobacteria bacterium J06627_28]